MKDHNLFVGLDLTVDEGSFCGPIRNVTHNFAEVVADGETRTVSLRGLSGLRTKRQPKISGPALTISDPKSDRTFSAENNPSTEAMRQQMDLSYLRDAKMDAAESRAAGAEVRIVSGAAQSEAQKQDREVAANQLDSTQGEVAGQLYNPGAVMSNAHHGAGAEFYDSYQVSFSISSPERIEDAYAALLVWVRAPTSPGQPFSAIALKKLPALDRKPRKISLECSGLPIGFAVDRYETHIYSQGRELATTLSEKCIAVTRTEAFQYLLLQDRLAHKAENLPPRLVTELVPSDFRDHIPASQLGRSVNIHVGREGNVTSVSFEGADATGEDTSIESLIRRALFFPALVGGEPVAAETTVVLEDFLPGSD